MRTQRMRTIRLYNMHCCNGWDCDGNMWPTVEPSHTVPDRLTTFQVSSAGDNADAFAHFFIDDYRFERIWNQPEKYVPILKKYAGVIAPDFSTYTDMPYPMQMWNKYRSMALAHYWQQCGIDVIPNVMFSDVGSFDWAFDGMPSGSVVALGSVGCGRVREWRENWAYGAAVACSNIRPSKILVYGPTIPFDSCGAEVIWYENENTARHRNIERRTREKAHQSEHGSE